jgi:hypothetical protein
MSQIKAVEKIKAHILCSVTFFPENRAVYEIMSKDMVEPERPHAVWRLRMAYCIGRQAHAQKCVILIAFRGNSAFANAAQCYVICTFSMDV